MPFSRALSRSPSPRRRRSLSYSRSRSPSSRSRSRSPPRRRDRSSSPSVAKNVVLVTNLTRNVTKEHIQEIFEHAAPVRNVDFPFNKRLNANAGKAYVEFETADDADKAIALMDKGQLDGKYLTCVIAPPRRRSPSPSPPPRRRCNSIFTSSVPSRWPWWWRSRSWKTRSICSRWWSTFLPFKIPCTSW
ncbi:uncharacterized protein BYT42DRAFT_231665 [Radiomyces spectabilis]|uniref:uncharacterized protein n=1 Tax=Radiomyces spectabilis TaxID=64574 RepID=UPI00221E662C|nr:uncharacterized protein BYT42DRAFT_231665 [Radiomyces spectabilis]KAI8388346.1 hypothetical protein BYT42DRAFT_231665 [Radiomyces spectabilis]